MDLSIQKSSYFTKAISKRLGEKKNQFELRRAKDQAEDRSNKKTKVVCGIFRNADL
ncbi:MAG: hypothetical protein AAFP26_11755 [Planctomycetota bacterium]